MSGGISKRTWLLIVCVAASCMSIIVSNIIANKQMDFFGLALPCAAMLVPIDYAIGDVVAEVYGFRTARTVVLLSFAMNLLAVAFFLLAISLPAYPTFTAQDAFETVLGNTPRLLAASFIAFIAGSLSNAAIMGAMHDRDGERRLALRCIASTAVGEFLDVTIFLTLGFAGTLPTDVVVQMIALHFTVKVAVECVLYALATRHIIRWAKGLAA